MATYRAYLMGYEPPAMPMDDLTQDDVEQMMAEADFCFTRGAGEGIAIGEVIEQDRVLQEGKGNAPLLSARLRCTGHLYAGKIVVLEEVSS